MNVNVEKKNTDVLSPLMRTLDVVFIIGLLLLLAFLVYHQQVNSGFFTDQFGTLGMICLYGPIPVGIIALAAQVWTGRRNPARPFEAVTALCVAAAALVLVSVFPFSFVHLADTLPEGLRFILAWVTDDIGKLMLILQVIIGPLSAILAVWKYLTFRRQEPEATLKRRAL